MNAFYQHTALLAQAEAFAGGGTAPATLQFPDLTKPTTVPCTHTMIEHNVAFELGGQSAETFIERCEFRASLFNPNDLQYLVKGRACILTVRPGAAPILLQLGAGGMMEGGQVYRFRLLDGNYRA